MIKKENCGCYKQGEQYVALCAAHRMNVERLSKLKHRGLVSENGGLL